MFIIFAAKTKLGCPLDIAAYFNIAKHINIREYLNIDRRNFESIKVRKRDKVWKMLKKQSKEVFGNTRFWIYLITVAKEKKLRSWRVKKSNNQGLALTGANYFLRKNNVEANRWDSYSNNMLSNEVSNNDSYKQKNGYRIKY